MAFPNQWSLLALLSTLLLGTSSADAFTRQELEAIYGGRDKVVCITVPKAGTHLLIKSLTLMNIEGIEYQYNEEKNQKKRVQAPYKKIDQSEQAAKIFTNLAGRMQKIPRRSFLAHLPFEESYKSFFEEFEVTRFLMLRDPRDQLISLAATASENLANRDQGGHLSKILLDLIERKQRYLSWSPRHYAVDFLWSVGLVQFYRSYLKWAEDPDVCVVHFENLVGPQGGGTIEAQFQEIKKIAAHLNVTLSDEKIQYIAENLFGESNTFKKGQAKSWEKYFNPKVKAAFKKVPGACQLLIDMGYEKDSDW